MLATLLCCLALGAGAVASPPDDEPALPASDEVTPLAFAWPLPSRALVTQVGVKQGSSATLEYSIALTELEDDLQLTFGDLKMLEVDGQDLRSPLMQQFMKQQMLPLQAAMPPLRIRRDGEFVGIDDWDAFIDGMERVFAALDEDKASSPELQAILEQMRSPEMEAFLHTTLEEQWSVWAGAWIDCELAVGEQMEFELELPIGDRLAAGTGTISRLPDVEGRMHLTETTRIDGADAIEGMQAVLAQLVPADQLREGGLPVAAMEKETSVDALIDPTTLRPQRVLTLERVSVTMEGERPQEQLEERDDRFEWQE